MKPFVTVEFPDKPRRLRFGINTLCEIEDVLGKSILDLDEIGMGIKEVRLFLLAAFREDEPELTLKDVGNLMDEYEGGWVALAAKIGEAVSQAMSSNDSSKNVPAPKTARKKKTSGDK